MGAVKIILNFALIAYLIGLWLTLMALTLVSLRRSADLLARAQRGEDETDEDRRLYHEPYFADYARAFLWPVFLWRPF